MQKNWYVVYTRPHFEKKVAQMLTKKRIDNFCPMNNKKIKSFRHNKIVLEPLFQSYVFVNIIESQIDLLKQLEGIINLLYWNHNPAIIKIDEIEIIKEFTKGYQSIELEKAKVNPGSFATVIDEPSYSLVGNGNLFSLKNKGIKIYLPSLGLIMIAKTKKEDYFTEETISLQNKSFSKP